MESAYYGHESQIRGVEEHRLVGGKGDGMRLFQVRNGLGLEFTVSADRGADISRLSFRGYNFNYMTVNGYVDPAFYDDQGAGWLKSFTAGFLTTCGLTAVGNPCEDDGEQLPLHGSASNTPCERIFWDEDSQNIRIKGIINHSQIFQRKLMMTRLISCSKVKNEITIHDTVTNQGDSTSPLMLLYHMNIGYPLLSETAELYIPAQSVTPRNAHAAEDLDTWNKILSPTPGFEEQCYYHHFGNQPGKAGIFNPAIGKGLLIEFDTSSLDCFTQWKMMGIKDYVIGLEPGNCHPDGRDVMRRQGKLKFLEPGRSASYELKLTMIDSAEDWSACCGM